MSASRLSFDNFGVHTVKFTFESNPDIKLRVHKELLDLHSTLFHEMFQPPFEEHMNFLNEKLDSIITTKQKKGEWSYHLPTRFNFRCFESIVDFMYSGTIIVDAARYTGPTRNNFHTATNLGVQVYADCVLAELRSHHQMNNDGFAMGEVKDIFYGKSRAHGSLWMYCLENVATRLANNDIRFNATEWTAFMKRNHGVAEDFIEAQARLGISSQFSETPAGESDEVEMEMDHAEMDDQPKQRAKKPKKTKELKMISNQMDDDQPEQPKDSKKARGNASQAQKKRKGVKSMQAKHKIGKKKAQVARVAVNNNQKGKKPGVSTKEMKGKTKAVVPNVAIMMNKKQQVAQKLQGSQRVLVPTVALAPPTNHVQGNVVSDLATVASSAMGSPGGRGRDRAPGCGLVFVKTEPGTFNETQGHSQIGGQDGAQSSGSVAIKNEPERLHGRSASGMQPAPPASSSGWHAQAAFPSQAASSGGFAFARQPPTGPRASFGPRYLFPAQPSQGNRIVSNPSHFPPQPPSGPRSAQQY